MAEKNKKIVLIDGNALVHRGYHALPPTIKTKDGELVNAVYGFCLILLNVLDRIKPKYIVATFDLRAPTFRHKESAEYKAHRVGSDQELYDQIPRVKQVLKAFNIPIFTKKGFEADDLIGTLSRVINHDTEKIIVTGDLDALQLVNKHTKVFTPKQGIKQTMIYGEAEVFDRYGLEPEQLIDYKALSGDKSDNIKGVVGIGDKTATAILQQFKTLENLYERIEAVDFKRDELTEEEQKILKPATLKRLQEGKDEAFLSQKLATIVCDVPIDFSLQDCELADYDETKVIKIFQDLEFGSLLHRIPKSEQTKLTTSQKPIDADYTIIRGLKELKNLVAKCSQQKIISLDTETTSENVNQAELVGVSISFKPKQAFYVPTRYQGKEVKFSGQSPLAYLKKIAENKAKKVGHNIKYDYRVLLKYDIEIKNLYFDTFLVAYLLNPGRRGYSLDNLVFSLLGHRMIPIKNLIGEKAELTMDQVDLKKAGIYACEDADFTLRLYNYLKPVLATQPKVAKVFSKIDMPTVEVLARMEASGIKIDTDYLKQLEFKLRVDLKELEENIYTLAGQEFNINSPAQLSEILFTKMGISTRGIRRTKTNYSTAASELLKLQNEHEIIPLIQVFRELSKLLSTYVVSLPELADPKTSRIHTSYNQTVAATGRLSSSDPNLQNIPIRTEQGQEIRKAFVAAKGYKLVAVDYSQVELRLAAYLSGDETMLKAFKDGEDIHTRVAAEIYDLRPDEVTPSRRRNAKTVNFGVLYGLGPYGLSERLRISYEAADEFISQYFAKFPKLKTYLDNSLTEATDKGYAETQLGRRRPLPELGSTNRQIRTSAERMAINMPIQGLAADIMKLAMVETYQEVVDKDCKMLLQVHDELVFEIKPGKVKDKIKKIKAVMEGVYKIDPKLVAEAKVGDNWKEMEVV